jgi:predicted Zn-dependent protease with MMP-like domain
MLQIDDDDFDDIVSVALDAVPDALAELIDNVVVVVEDEPGPDDVAVFGDDGADGDDGDDDLLGLYEGTDLTSRSMLDPGFGLPDRITIFRGPHLRAVRSRRELRRLVTETVVHEIAHHFGIDDDRLDELGWA